MKSTIIIFLLALGLIVWQVSDAGACLYPPTADAGPNQRVPISTTVDFDGSDSHDNDEGGYRINRYSWRFGSGASPSTGSGDSPSCTYSTSGAKYVYLTVTDDESQQDNDLCVIRVVKVNKLQYYADGYVDVSGVLYVLRGTAVRFKAIKSGSSFWPSGKPVWGGSSGASGTGETKVVTFNTVSSSPTDYKTVTAECGNTVTANVIVGDPGISPSSRLIYDGESGGTFTVTDDEGATAWEWSYDISTYQPAGNSPSCSFSPTDEQSSTVSTKWYAYPDSVCGASAGCTYNIFCAVTINGEDFDAGPTALYVQILLLGGTTVRPRVDGGFGYDDGGTPPNIWRVVSQGDLYRKDSFATLVTIYTPQNSQFYSKAYAHEDEHLNQWTTGFMKDYFTVDSYWNFDTQYDCKVKHLTALTETALMQKFDSTLNNWDLEQWNAANTPENDAAMEGGAYAVSDQYAPHYRYEGECHGY